MQISKDWNISLDDRRLLFRSCAAILDKNEESSGAFEVYQAYLKLFEKAKDAELAKNNIEEEAKRCMLLAIKEPTVIDFAEVMRLKAVKFL